MISTNALKIEGLKKTIDFVCAEVQDLKNNVKDVDSRLKDQERLTGTWVTRISDLERYSRRWNLRLFGVPETFKEDIKSEVIRICSETYAEAKNKYPDVVDTVHRLGKRGDNTKPCAVMMQFTSRVIRDALWKAAKKTVSPRQQPALCRGSDFSGLGETEELVAESERGEGSWKNSLLHRSACVH